MKKFKYLLFLFAFLVAANGYSQKCNVKGVVSDPEADDVLIGATVKVLKGGSQERGAVTGIEGDYNISGLDPGVYDVEFSYLGYQTLRITNVILSAGEIIIIDGKLKVDDSPRSGCGFSTYWPPLIQMGKTSGRMVFDSDDIIHRAGRW